MKICSADQIREIDRYTIEQEPISSLRLMERAAGTFVRWVVDTFPDNRLPVHIVCGIGNNGGDGLVAARLLHHAGYEVTVYICALSPKGSPDFEANRKRLPGHGAIDVQVLEEGAPWPAIPTGALLLDALFGSGLNRPVEGYWAEWLNHLNHLHATRVAIDIPSGVFADRPTTTTSFHADYTFSFELPKLAFFFPENAHRVGDWTVGAIGLHPEALAKTEVQTYYLTAALARPLMRKRAKFSHKGTYGHALLVMGSYGKMGAALLAAKAALRSGAGLLSLHVPKTGYAIVQTALPEAMVSLDAHELQFSEVPDTTPYQAIGAGCGLGQGDLTTTALFQLIRQSRTPMVLDADALNLLARQPDELEAVPENSILTPHPKEFERLFGSSGNDFERHQLLLRKAANLQLIIVLKGAHTCIALPDGRSYFNSTGNPGMATGGSGDVLAGVLTGLLAQGYHPVDAARLGVYLHGLAGDCALRAQSQASLIASDLTAALGDAFGQLERA